MSDLVNRNLNWRIRQALYVLKRNYGSTVTLYTLVSASTDYTTGVKTVSQTPLVIRRCIVLPVKMQREVSQGIAAISANKEFAYGGSYDVGTREFVIDSRDLPAGTSIQQDDWLLYNDRRYELKSIEELEQHTGWHIIGKEVLRPEVHNETVPETLPITSDVFRGMRASGTDNLSVTDDAGGVI